MSCLRGLLVRAIFRVEDCRAISRLGDTGYQIAGLQASQLVNYYSLIKERILGIIRKIEGSMIDYITTCNYQKSI